jgi:hypothetical protein
VIDKAIGNQNLGANIWIRGLEGGDRGLSSVSEMLGGAESRNVPETFDSLLEIMLSTASLTSTLRIACSRISDPKSVSRRLSVERSNSPNSKLIF